MLKIFILLAHAVIFCNCKIEIETVPLPTQTNVGESPYSDTKSMYLTDTFQPNPKNGQFFRVDYATGKVYPGRIKDMVARMGFMLPIEGMKDHYAMGAERSVIIMKWNGCDYDAEFICEQAKPEPEQNNHLHDGKIAPNGALWMGTVRTNLCQDDSKPRGVVRSMSDGQNAKHVYSNQTIPNSYDWDETNYKWYCANSCGHGVTGCDVNLKTNEVSNCKQVWTHTPKWPIDSVPDGILTTTCGKVVVNINGNSTICIFDPKTGRTLLTIEVPCTQDQTIAWGGPKHDEIWVTSTSTPFNANGALLPVPRLAAPCGHLFRIKGTGYRGVPPKKSLDPINASCVSKGKQPVPNLGLGMAPKTTDTSTLIKPAETPAQPQPAQAPAPAPTEAPAEPQSTQAPAQPQSTQAPAQPQSTQAPAQPQSTQAPAQPQSTQAPAQPQSTRAPAQPQSTQAPAQPQSTQAPAQPQSTKAPAQPPQPASQPKTTPQPAHPASQPKTTPKPEKESRVEQVFQNLKDDLKDKFSSIKDKFSSLKSKFDD